MKKLLGASLMAMLVGSGVGLKVGSNLNTSVEDPEMECPAVVLKDGQATFELGRHGGDLMKTALAENMSESVDIQQLYCRFFDKVITCHVYSGGGSTVAVTVPSGQQEKFYQMANEFFENKIANLAILQCNFKRRQEKCVGTGAKVVDANAIPTGAVVLYGNLEEEEPENG